MAARKRRLVLSDEWKERISAGCIMDRLLKHVNGELNMESTQVKAADILLKKIVPDLARSEITGKDGKDLTITSRHEFLDELKKLAIEE